MRSEQRRLPAAAPRFLPGFENGHPCMNRMSAPSLQLTDMNTSRDDPATTASAIADSLAAASDRPSRLRQLDLSSNRFGDAAAAAFGAALAAQGRCCSPSVSGGCGGGAATPVGPCGLTELRLMYTTGKISHSGALALADGVRKAGAWLRTVGVAPLYGRGSRAALLRAAKEWRERHAAAAAEAGGAAPPALELVIPYEDKEVEEEKREEKDAERK